MEHIKKICVLILLTLFIPNSVYAAGYIDENPSAYPPCGTYTKPDGTVVQLEWCYTSVGYRFSLYRYDGTTLTKKGKSFDTTTQHTYNFVGRRALKANSQTLGRLDYTELGKSINWTSTYYTLNYGDSLKDATGSATYSLAPPMDNDTGRTVRGDIEEYFFLDGGVSNNILNRLKSLFDVTSLTLSDISKLYITVEPTIYFYKATGTGGYAYYGTVYEILNIPASAGANTAGGASLFGINGVIYKSLPQSIITVQGGSPADPNRLVGTSSSVKIKFTSSDSSFTSGEYNNSDRQTNRGLVFAEGYGIGVYKIFDYTTADCSSSCSSYTVDSFNRLKCAENYCHDNTSTVSEKEDCIVACGYAKPEAIACTATSTPNSSSTCAGKVSASKTTCSVTADKYFTTECVETTTLTYPDLEGKHDLLLNKKYDFPYVVYTEGNKKCTKKFNYKLFQFNYATKRNNTQRTNLKNTVFDGVYFKSNDTSIGSHKYNETWQTHKLNNSAQDYALTWVNNGTNTYISSTSTQNFRVLANGVVSWINGKFDKKVYQSNNAGTIIVNEPLKLPSARIPFITNTDTSKTNVVKIKKDSSNLDSTNRCNYQPKTSVVDLKCYAEEVTYPSGRTSNAKARYVIKYTTRSSTDAMEQKGSHSNLKYSFGGSWYNVNSTFKVTNINIPYSAGKTVTKVMTVKTSDGKTVTCPAVASFDGATCNIRLSKHNVNNANFYDDKIKVSTNASGVVCKRQNGTTISALNADGRSIFTSSILNPTSPHEIITCTGTTSTGAVCTDQISTGTCSVYKPNDYTNISNYCTKYGVIDGYGSDQACISKCARKCPSCPTEATNSQVNSWCSNSTNLTDAGYVNKEQCLNDCSCKGELGEYIFRPITLGKKSGAYLAFPNRTPGGNWVGVEKKTETTTFSEPIYVINLDKDAILKIRNNTSSNKSTAYIPYEQLSKEQKKADFNSSFLNGLDADEFCETTPARRCS